MANHFVENKQLMVINKNGNKESRDDAEKLDTPTTGTVNASMYRLWNAKCAPARNDKHQVTERSKPRVLLCVL